MINKLNEELRAKRIWNPASTAVEPTAPPKSEWEVVEIDQPDLIDPEEDSDSRIARRKADQNQEVIGIMRNKLYEELVYIKEQESKEN